MAYQTGDQPVPGYKLETFLGQGSYGSVWKATGPGGVPCAMKFISLASKSGLKEMKAIGLIKRLQHPNLCPVQAIWLRDEEGNLMSDTPGSESTRFLLGGNKELIIAMGLGQKTLAQRLEECRGRGGIPIRDLIRYMEDAAKGIDYLNDPVHDLGHGPASVIHCDIKPANLLLVGGGVQVCDYGVARALSATGGDVRKTFAAGTPAYAPAELINNEPTNQTDQYSLAITYFELRTGHLPFDEAKAIIANLTGQLDLSDVTPDEQEVLRQATAIQPAQRFENCQEMVEALKMAARVTVSTGRHPRPPSSGITQFPDPASGIRGTPQPGSDPRYTPSETSNPRASDRVRFTPEPPDGYGIGAEAIWPPSGPLKPPGSGVQPPPGSGRANAHPDTAAPPPNTPYGNQAPSYPAAQPNEPGYLPDGTIRFESITQQPPNGGPGKNTGGVPGFADDSFRGQQPPASPYGAPQSKVRPKAEDASEKLLRVWAENGGKSNKPTPRPNSNWPVILAAISLFVIGGGAAAVYFLVIKPGNEVVQGDPPTSTTSTTAIGTGTIPTVPPPPDITKLTKLRDDINRALDNEQWQDIPQKLEELRKLPNQEAASIATELEQQLQANLKLAPTLKDLKKAIADEDRDAAEELLDKLKIANSKLATRYTGQVNSLPRSEDPIKLARSEFRTGKVAEGLTLLQAKLKEPRFKPQQREEADKLVKLWSAVRMLADTSAASVAELQKRQSSGLELAKSADTQDRPTVENFLNQQLANKAELLIPKLERLTRAEWQLLNDLGSRQGASPLLQAVAVEAAIELKQADQTAQPNGLTRTVPPDANATMPLYSDYLQGRRDYLSGAKKPEEIIQAWEPKFTDPLPGWITKPRAGRMVEILKAALPENEPKTTRTRFDSWKNFIQAVSTRSGDTLQAPPEFELDKYKTLLAAVQDPAKAALKDYSKLYSGILRELGKPATKQTIIKLPAAAKKELVELLTNTGQHIMVNQLAWDAVPELVADKLFAASLAESLFDTAYSLQKSPDTLVWRGIARLLQPESDEGKLFKNDGTEVISTASEPLRALLNVLQDIAKTRYLPKDRPDLKDQIKSHRDIHKTFATLLANTPAFTTSTAKLLRKQAIQHAVALAELDQSNYFRQERVIKTVESWCQDLGQSPDELFLRGRVMEAYCLLLKPYQRFSLVAARDIPNSYQEAQRVYRTANANVDNLSSHLLLAEARSAYRQETDLQSQKPDSFMPTARAESYLDRLKTAIDEAKGRSDAELLAQLYYWNGNLRMHQAARNRATKPQLAFSECALAIESFTEGLKQVNSRDTGFWYDEMLHALLLAREFDSLLALAIRDDNLTNKLNAFQRDLDRVKSAAAPKRMGFRARWTLNEQKVLKTARSQPLTLEDYRQVIALIPKNKDVTQTLDAEVLSELHLELGNKILIEEIKGYATPAARAASLAAIDRAIKEFDVAYQLIDDYPFMSAITKARSAGFMGTWYYYKGKVYEAEKKETDYLKAYQSALEPLKYSLLYTPLVEEYWTWQVHRAGSLAISELSLDPKREDVNQQLMKSLLERVGLMLDAKTRLKDSQQSRSNPVKPDPGTENDLNTLDKRLDEINSKWQGRLEQVEKNLTPSELAQAKVIQAELLLTVSGKPDEEAKGKALAQEWLPKLKKAMPEPATEDGFKLYDRYMMTRLYERVEKLAR